MAIDISGVLSLSPKDHLNEGMIAAAVLSVSLVALSTYGRRLCRHPAVRFFVWGSSIVFLQLTSFIISSLLKTAKVCKKPPMTEQEFDDECKPEVQNMWTLLLWIVLILVIKCNADAAAAAVTTAAASPVGGDVSVDGQRMRPPLELVFKYIWAWVLIILCFPKAGWVSNSDKAVFVAFCAVGFAKVVLKLAALSTASRSFSVGKKNARLIAGYMAQLAGIDGDEQAVPRYIVMGETKKHVVETPQGFHVKRDVLDDKLSRSLITLDRVWRLAEHGDGILAERQELRDLCLSYSLFKILRQRLSGNPPPLTDAGSGEAALNFVLRGMDSVGSGVNVDRVFRVLVDELWFASDFYYSPIPLCTLGGCCAILNYLCSVLIIVGAGGVGYIYKGDDLVNPTIYTVVITYSLLTVVVLLETWEIIAGVCSNWTKMALLGHYIRHENAWRQSSRLHASLAAVLRLRPARRWRDKIGQNSVLEPRRFRRRTGLLLEKLYGRAGLMRSVAVSQAVKDAVLRSLLSSYGRMSNGSAAAQRVVGGKVDWALYGAQKSWAWENSHGSSSNTELILTWHVATRLFEMKSTSASPDMTAASHLSNYFAYLVAAAPELLPDCVEWSKKRYEEVSEDVRVALGADDAGGSESTTEGRYRRLVEELSAVSRDTVLQRGAELGRHLVKQYGEDEASACRILADFWSEMVLYVAPSENVKGHVQAMARGGEFITLVWALLIHAGVTTRPADTPHGSIP